MSKIGKQPIQIPNNVTVNLDGRTLMIKGPKGEVTREIPRELGIKVENDEIVLEKESSARYAQSLWGLWRALLANSVTGVHEGFEKRLELNGVGYRAAMKGKDLELQLGLSHSVIYAPADGVSIAVEDKYIIVTGMSKQAVGQTAAEIRSFREPEPYKGKGIKYTDEVIRRKAGKAAKAAA